MKITNYLVSCILCLGLMSGLVQSNAEEPVSEVSVWTIDANSDAWSRDADGITIVSDENKQNEGRATTHILHRGERDWSLSKTERIPVTTGDVFRITANVCAEGTWITPSIVLRHGEDVVNWVYGGHELHPSGDWQTYDKQLMIPRNVDNITFRLVGDGQGEAWLDRIQMKKLYSNNVVELAPITIKNEYLQLEFIPNTATFCTTNLRTGKVYNQHDLGNILVSEVNLVPGQDGQERIEATFLHTVSCNSFQVSMELVQDRPEVVVRLKGNPDQEVTGEISWPQPIESRRGERVVLPMNEGISFPVEEGAPGAEWLHTFGGHGLCMSFFGQVTDTLDMKASDGYLAIVETPDDCVVRLSQRPTPTGEKLLMFNPSWIGQKERFGYDRVLRYCFFDNGGYVALCKRYREYAKAQGLLVTFDEKVKRNPALTEGMDRLIGAANIWCWDKNRVELVQELVDAGLDRILWSAGGSAEEIQVMNQFPHVLTSRYDVYQDLMDPELIPQTAMKKAHDDWTQTAWPQDVNWSNASGDLRTGWSVEAAEATLPRISCVVLCDRQAIPYAKKRISNELNTTPYRARFLDTTTASPWQECWSPEHPMTRTDGKYWKMKLLELIGKEFNLVCGSETGHEASVPYCDFFEGMMSLGSYRVPDSGRDMLRVWDEVPENLAKYQLGPEYRLPLWELVYHDCTVSYWYWGDYNNKLPSVWWKRDLFNALYGVPPMYMFTRHQWEEQKEQFVASYKIAEPVSRLTGQFEMTDHRILTEDRLVQETMFANGYRVIANFSDTPYSGDGAGTETVEPRSVRILQ